MVLQMARPTKSAKTGVYYFRQKTLADLVAIVGKKEVGWSLGTKDPEQAKALNTRAVQKQAMVRERYRKRPEPLPHAKIVALSGILYRDYMSAGGPPVQLSAAACVSPGRAQAGHRHTGSDGAATRAKPALDTRLRVRSAARATLAAWRTDCNTERPHSRLGWRTPAAIARTFTPQRGLTLRNPKSFAPAPVAQPAQIDKIEIRSLAHAG